MSHGNILVREDNDGAYVKALAAASETVFGNPAWLSLGGDRFDRDGETWFTPGNGSDELTPERREKVLAVLKDHGVDAKDVTDWTDAKLTNAPEKMSRVSVAMAEAETPTTVK